MKQQVETEIKLRVDDTRAIKRRLKALGFRRLINRHFESNRLFDFPDLSLAKARCLLRLRRVRGRTLLTFKGPPSSSTRFKVRREFETEVKGGLLEAVLATAGLRQVLRYDKYRTEYRRAGDARALEVMYDETPIGNFLELEGARRAIDRTARALGFSERDYVTASYVALYYAWCRGRGIKPGNMTFPGEKRRRGEPRSRLGGRMIWPGGPFLAL